MRPIEPALHRLLSAGRAVSGLTKIDLENPVWEDAVRRILVLRLSPFADVDRSSSHLILFAEIRAALPDAYIDFSFLPDRGDRELLSRIDPAAPWFFGAASGYPPSSFGLILVSNAFGLELINLPRLFSTSGLPLRASRRIGIDAALPVVILGGSNAGQCGALVDAEGDSLVDGIFFGEGEAAIGPLAEILSDASLSRRDRLDRASTIDGFWSSLRPGVRAHRRILRGSPPALLSWPLFDGSEAGTARLQITAGCPGFCSFCFEGWDRRPYRELPLSAVLEAAGEIRARNGVDTLDVYSFNFNTHEEVFKLMYELNRIFKTVNFMSQRLDILAGAGYLVPAELAADKRSFALGIEGISARMRAWYRKGLDEEALDRVMSRLITAGVREIKLFYIISGFENEADLAEFSAFAGRVKELREGSAPGIRVLASAGYLVRLPGTPLRYAPLILDEAAFRKIVVPLDAACDAAGIEWRLAVHFDEYCVDQLLSLGGGRLLPWLESIPEGALVYDGGLSREAWRSLEFFAKAAGILDEGFLGEKDASSAPVLPILDEGNSGLVLYREYLEAKAFVDRESCLGGRCSGCGACDDEASRIFLTRHRTDAGSHADIDRLTRLLAAKRAFASLRVVVDRPSFMDGVSAPAQGAWLLRTLVRSHPEAWRQIFAARLVFPRPLSAFGMPDGSTGLSIFELSGPASVALSRLASNAGLSVADREVDPGSMQVSVAFPDCWCRSFELESGLDPSTARGAVHRNFAEWLGRSHLAHTEIHEGELRRYVISNRDLGKKAVFSAALDSGSLEIEIGPKADLASFASSFGPRAGALLPHRIVSWKF